MNAHFLTLPACMSNLGGAHGDIVAMSTGEIYVSVESGDRPGIQVYSPQGHYLRNIPNAPNDLHGFIIATGSDGIPNIFGASLFGQQIVQLTLDGRVVLTIPSSSVPERYKMSVEGKRILPLTSVAVAANGDIYALDGYGRDFIHRFDKEGRYLSSFGGCDEPWGFKNCHKLIIDSRFEPPRLLCADRAHGRLIHMDLEGRVIGVFAEGLRQPSALAVYRDELAVAELGGRVAILDKRGRIITVIGSNENEEQTKTNRTPPQVWKPEVFYAPHGVTYDPLGHLLVTEWSLWGRVVRVGRSWKN